MAQALDKGAVQNDDGSGRLDKGAVQREPAPAGAVPPLAHSMMHTLISRPGQPRFSVVESGFVGSRDE